LTENAGSVSNADLKHAVFPQNFDIEMCEEVPFDFRLVEGKCLTVLRADEQDEEEDEAPFAKSKSNMTSSLTSHASTIPSLFGSVTNQGASAIPSLLGSVTNQGATTVPSRLRAIPSLAEPSPFGQKKKKKKKGKKESAEVENMAAAAASGAAVAVDCDPVYTSTAESAAPLWGVSALPPSILPFSIPAPSIPPPSIPPPSFPPPSIPPPSIPSAQDYFR
jgi:hypothetical protein